MMSSPQPTTDLSLFNNSWYKPGSALKRIAWYVVHAAFINSAQPIGSLRKLCLRMFGARIGKGVVIKPNVRIKYPWKLRVGDNSWIGEDVWIDNLGEVSIGDNCCLSQGAMLLCGNHDYTKQAFDLRVGDIVLEDGVWIGAKSIVCPGVVCQSHAVLTVGSVASGTLESFGIYRGNPAVHIKKRLVNA